MVCPLTQGETTWLPWLKYTATHKLMYIYKFYVPPSLNQPLNESGIGKPDK